MEKEVVPIKFMDILL